MLMAGKNMTALLEIEPMEARALQKVQSQLPIAGYFGRRRWHRQLGGTTGIAQRRRDRVADLRGFPGFQLERIDHDRVPGRGIVVEHDAWLAIEHALAHRQPIHRVFPAVPGEAQPWHEIDTFRLDHLAVDKRFPGDALDD